MWEDPTHISALLMRRSKPKPSKAATASKQALSPIHTVDPDPITMLPYWCCTGCQVQVHAEQGCGSLQAGRLPHRQQARLQHEHPHERCGILKICVDGVTGGAQKKSCGIPSRSPTSLPPRYPAGLQVRSHWTSPFNRFHVPYVPDPIHFHPSPPCRQDQDPY